MWENHFFIFTFFHIFHSIFFIWIIFIKFSCKTVSANNLLYHVTQIHARYITWCDSQLFRQATTWQPTDCVLIVCCKELYRANKLKHPCTSHQGLMYYVDVNCKWTSDLKLPIFVKFYPNFGQNWHSSHCQSGLWSVCFIQNQSLKVLLIFVLTLFRSCLLPKPFCFVCFGSKKKRKGEMKGNNLILVKLNNGLNLYMLYKVNSWKDIELLRELNRTFNWIKLYCFKSNWNNFILSLQKK